MTTIISWNIQNGIGVDGNLSIGRIADTIKNICDPDIICLQEVSRNFILPDRTTADQVSELSQMFDGYTPVFGIAIDLIGPDRICRSQYGNLILSRYPILSVFCHPLPQPADGSIKQMPRQMIEITVQTPSQSLRIMTTHLEFHSRAQRLAQAQRIMTLQSEIAALKIQTPAYTDDGPYARFERTSSSIICGDFNFLADSPEYNIFTNNDTNESSIHDAWMLANPIQPHAPTCGIFDQQQWPMGPHCRDFMFISRDLIPSVMEMFVDTNTAASDHQPLVINLDVS
jgi:endonuclease/exonuclease/phosphatase family metal-dependent hydrolase